MKVEIKGFKIAHSRFHSPADARQDVFMGGWPFRIPLFRVGGGVVSTSWRLGDTVHFVWAGWPA